MAVGVGAFAASTVSADQVAIAFPAGCRLSGGRHRDAERDPAAWTLGGLADSLQANMATLTREYEQPDQSV